MSISNLSSAAVEHAPPRVVALNTQTENKAVEKDNKGERNARPVNRPDANPNARAVEATAHARTQAAQNAQVLQFDADKDVKAQQQNAAGEKAQQEKQQSPDAIALEQALEITNRLSTLQVRELEFTASKEDGQTVIRVIDKENDEVIRQIPSEEFIKLAQRVNDLTQELNSAQGLLFESKV